MKRIKKVEIAGVDVLVKYHPLLDCVGCYQHNQTTITIDPDEAEKPTAEDTLMHELAHAGLELTGLAEALGSQLEEAVVVWIERIYLPAARKALTELGKG